ncbi:hypothetical protein L218DRAFT_651760 [Marasmius fiardii PR-910]|nr:hypothetical protein L218DRAFT_651760 [Marasmius fiardii PR-910]
MNTYFDGQAPAAAYANVGSSTHSQQHRHYGDHHQEQEICMNRGVHGHPPPTSYLAPVHYPCQAGPGLLPDIWNSPPTIPTTSTHSGSSCTNSQVHSHGHGNRRKQRSTSHRFTGSASQSLPPGNVIHGIGWNVMSDERGQPVGPTNYVLVPQGAYLKTLDRFRGDSIVLQQVGFPEPGVPVSVSENNLPVLLKNDLVPNHGNSENKARILWPGYSPEFVREIRINRDCKTRTDVLLKLVDGIGKFIDWVERNHIKVKPGFENWQVGYERPSITIDDLFITGLVHYGGADWQPEIWCRRYRAI